MRPGHVTALASILLLATATPALTPRVRRGPTAPRLTKPSPKPKTANGIDSARATQIQNALIKAGYLSGSPSGVWDAPTQAAMEKLQADNGWQTKLVPDSRALIKLGLGPNSDSTSTGESAALASSASTAFAR
jgi:Putative peptidoglycan binding domain